MEILKLLENLENHSLETIYVLKAWKKLSDEKKIDKKYSFENFYNQEINVENLLNIFNNLSKTVKLFNIYKFNPEIYNKKDLIEMLNIVKKETLPNVNEIFYNSKTDGSYVSDQIAELGIKLLDNNFEELYVPFTHSFSYANFTNKKIYADFYMTKAAIIAELINILENKDIEFHMTNALKEPTFIDKNASHLLRKFDCVLSFPPIRVIEELDISKDIFDRFHFPKSKVLDIAHFEHVIAQTKNKALISLPVGFTYRSNNEENFRKKLIEENLLETIIILPRNILLGTQTEMTFFIINKNKLDNKIYFLNLNNDSFLIKSGKKTIFKDFSQICEIYNNKKEISNISTIVEKEQIINNNYSLAIDRYIQDPIFENIQNKLEGFELIALEKIADVRRSQLLKDEEKGINVYEISPSDFISSNFTLECGKIKKIDKNIKKLELYKLEPYDVLLSTKGTIGGVAIIGEIKEPMVASQAIQVIRIKDTNNKKNKAITLYMFLKSDLGQSILSSLVFGTVMPQISTDEIKQLNIPILSKEQEFKLIENFELENRLNEEINEINKKIKLIHTNFLN